MASTTISVLTDVVVIFRSLVEAVIVGEPLPENVSVAPFPLNVPLPVALNVVNAPVLGVVAPMAVEFRPVEVKAAT